MSRIFISYRREQAAGHAGRLYDRLADHFGRDNLFMDLEIELGVDFAEYINRAVQTCDALIALIDRQWLTCTDAATGERRLDNPEDFVRLEISAALSRDIRVIPVLLQNTPMPRAGDLPDELKSLSRRQGLHLDDGRFHTDVDRLIEALDRLLSGVTRDPPSPASGPPATFTNDMGMRFALIPAGEFLMGTPADQVQDVADRYGLEPDWVRREVPQHKVRISQPFYLGMYPVIQAQWQAVMDGQNPSQFTGDPSRPVENVSWNDVQGFIEALNRQESMQLYRLPTEAEWEYACRAGSTTQYSFGDDPDQLGAYAWYRDNAQNTTQPVGHLQPNAWNLYDMHGNVCK